MVASAALGCGSEKLSTDGGVDAAPPDATIDGPSFLDSGPPGCVACSPDFHDVLNCGDGGLVEHCAPDAGCVPGAGCGDPCLAAQAAGTNAGCQFYAGTVAPEYENRGSCYAVLLANTWSSPAAISASWGTTTLNVNQIARVPTGSGATLAYKPLATNEIAPGALAILFLSEYSSGDHLRTACPSGVKAGVIGSTAVDGTGIGKSFHITSSAPVVAYDIYPYGGAASWVTSASMLLPTPAWGTNYVASDAYKFDDTLAPVNGYPFIQIYAMQATKVAIAAAADITPGGGLAGTKAGTVGTYSVGAGQFLQFMQQAELNGSLITSNAPIAVWGGTSCMHVPWGVDACDSGHQQLWPVTNLGSEYAAVRYGNRPNWPSEEVVPWRLVGAVDGTQLVCDPPQTGAPATLKASETIEINSAGPFVVRSQDAAHPFYMSGYMTGACQCYMVECGVCDPNQCPQCAGAFIGDPEYVNVIATGQYLSSYTFLTDPTYANTNLVFIRSRASDSTFHDVALDCVGKLSGWQAIGASSYEYTRVDLVKQGTPQGGCDNGVHKANSDVPFGLTVWGYDETVSYAYTAGANAKPINTVVIGPPVPN